nr:MAG TPA: hypothetical protein [Caudoviricetes sp.]
MFFWKNNGSVPAGQRRYFQQRITHTSLTVNNCLWYNIDNERGRKLDNVTESQQTGYNGPGKRFPSLGYNSPLNR